jgi:hypothetical protein
MKQTSLREELKLLGLVSLWLLGGIILAYVLTTIY